jgi:hypothetical protein
MSKSDALVQDYMREGRSYEEACALAGVRAVREEVSSMDAEGMSDEELIELNGSLAIRAINKALTSGKIDNTMIQAAIRAVQMLTDLRASGGGSDPEDDMLAWVADINRRERDG